MEFIVERASDRQEDLMIDLNIAQMQAGKRNDDTRITPEYAPKTIILKKKKGQPYDRVTLRDTGDFHNSLRVKRYPRQKELFAYDVKSEYLQDKYGDGILGLNQLSLNLVKEKMKPLMIRDARNFLKNRR